MKTSIEDVQIGNCKVSIKVEGDYFNEIRRTMSWLENLLTEQIEAKPTIIPEGPIEAKLVVAVGAPITESVIADAIVGTSAPPPDLVAPAVTEKQIVVPLTCLGIVPADFPSEAKTTRDVVRVIFGKGVREFDDVVKVCTTLKDEVRVLKHLNVETVLPRAYKMVLAEEASAEK